MIPRWVLFFPVLTQWPEFKQVSLKLCSGLRSSYMLIYVTEMEEIVHHSNVLKLGKIYLIRFTALRVIACFCVKIASNKITRFVFCFFFAKKGWKEMPKHLLILAVIWRSSFEEHMWFQIRSLSKLTSEHLNTTFGCQLFFIIISIHSFRGKPNYRSRK